MIDEMLRKINKSDLNNLSLKKLKELYFKLSNPVYFRTHDNMDNILNVIREVILKKIDEKSVLDVIDFYSDIFIETLKIDELVESNQNIITVRNINLEDEFFKKYEPKRRNMSEEDFLKEYKKNLKYYENNAIYAKKSFNALDKLLDNTYKYLDNRISNIDIEEKRILHQEINNIIDKNAREILSRIELRKNKKLLEVQSKFKEKTIYELFNMLDTTNLRNKNYVYTNFSELTKLKSNKK